MRYCPIIRRCAGWPFRCRMHARRARATCTRRWPRAGYGSRTHSHIRSTRPCARARPWWSPTNRFNAPRRPMGSRCCAQTRPRSHLNHHRRQRRGHRRSESPRCSCIHGSHRASSGDAQTCFLPVRRRRTVGHSRQCGSCVRQPRFRGRDIHGRDPGRRPRRCRNPAVDPAAAPGAGRRSEGHRAGAGSGRMRRRLGQRHARKTACGDRLLAPVDGAAPVGVRSAARAVALRRTRRPRPRQRRECRHCVLESRKQSPVQPRPVRHR